MSMLGGLFGLSNLGTYTTPHTHTYWKKQFSPEKKYSKKKFYGINSGNYGFLMNKFSSKNFINNISNSKLITISPLEMKVKKINKQIKSYLAINEVSILRQSRQAAYLTIKYGNKQIIKKLVSDGIIVFYDPLEFDDP